MNIAAVSAPLSSPLTNADIRGIYAARGCTLPAPRISRGGRRRRRNRRARMANAQLAPAAHIKFSLPPTNAFKQSAPVNTQPYFNSAPISNGAQTQSPFQSQNSFSNETQTNDPYQSQTTFQNEAQSQSFNNQNANGTISATRAGPSPNLYQRAGNAQSGVTRPNRFFRQAASAARRPAEPGGGRTAARTPARVNVNTLYHVAPPITHLPFRKNIVNKRYLHVSPVSARASAPPPNRREPRVFCHPNVAENPSFSFSDYNNISRTIRPTSCTLQRADAASCTVEGPGALSTAAHAGIRLLRVASTQAQATPAQQAQQQQNDCPLISPRTFVNLRCNSRLPGAVVRVLYDSGAETSILTPRDLARLRALGVPMEPVDKAKYGLRAANGSQMPIDEIVKVSIVVDGKTLVLPMVVAPTIECSIIGTNGIHHFGLRPSGEELTCDFHASAAALEVAPALVAKPLLPLHIPARVGQWSWLQLHTVNGCQVDGKFTGVFDTGVTAGIVETDNEGRFQAYIDNVDFMPLHLHPHDEVGAVRPISNYHFVAKASPSAASSKQDVGIPVGSIAAPQSHPPPPDTDLNDQPVGNATAQPGTTKAAGTFGVLGESNDNDKHRLHTPQENEHVRQLLRDNINKHTPPSHRDAMLKVVLDNPEAFSAHRNDIGKCTVVEHEIHLTTDKKLHTKQFRLANNQFDEIKDQTVAWLKSGIVRRERSAYNNPVFCVEKPHGRGLRVVSDFRVLNSHSHVDKYCIPSVDEVLSRIGEKGANVFTSIDLSSGFYHIPIKREHQKYTAFTLTGIGQFVWTRAAMGLSGSPATFSRALDEILHDLDRVVCYVDDICLYHLNIQEQARQLDVVLKRLAAHGLRANPEKSVFGVPRLDYLGAELSSRGIRPPVDKVQAIRDLQPPATVKELQSVLGFFNYMASYVFHYAAKVEPLQALIRKDSGWKGGPISGPALDAFRQIKHEVSQRPLLSFVVKGQPLHLYVDCALGSSRDHGSGMGAALMQDRPDGRQEPIALIARQLGPHERFYPAPVAEWKAAAWAMLKLKPYLKWHRFYVHSDCKPLVELNINLKSAHEKTIKHAEMLISENFYPVWRHVKGADNVCADFLSRHFGFNCHLSRQKWTPKRRRQREAAVAAVTSRSDDPNGADRRPERTKLLQHGDDECLKIMSHIRDDVQGSNMAFPKWGHSPKVKFPVTCIDDFLLVKPKLPRGFFVRQRMLAGNGEHESDGLVYYAPVSLRPELLAAGHAEHAPHYGEEKCFARIVETHWWPSIRKDIKRYIATCDTCLRATNKGTPPPAPLIPIATPRLPNELWHVDLVGPLTAGDTEGTYIMCVVDGLSNYTEIIHLPNKTAGAVAVELMQLIRRRGCPRVITSDGGLEFRNTMQTKLWDALGIDRRWTTPYYPQVNGRVEVFNRTLGEMLRKHRIDAGAKQTDFVAMLPRIQQQYNLSHNSATKMTPHEVFYGYDPLMPLYEEFMPNFREQTPGLSRQDFIAAHFERLRAARANAYQNQQIAKAKMKEQHDKSTGAKWPLYKPREAVLLAVTRKIMPNAKLAEMWVPGHIIRRVRPKTFIVHSTSFKTKNNTKVWTSKYIKPDPNRDPLDRDTWEQCGGNPRELSPASDTSDDEQPGPGRSGYQSRESDDVADGHDDPGDAPFLSDPSDDEDVLVNQDSPQPGPSRDAALGHSPRRPARASPPPPPRRRQSSSSERPRSRSPRRPRSPVALPGNAAGSSQPVAPPPAATEQQLDDEATGALYRPLASSDDDFRSEPPESQLMEPPEVPEPPARRRRQPWERLEDSQDVFGGMPSGSRTRRLPRRYRSTSSSGSDRIVKRPRREVRRRRRHDEAHPDSDSPGDGKRPRQDGRRRRRHSEAHSNTDSQGDDDAGKHARLNKVDVGPVRAAVIAHVHAEISRATKYMRRQILQSTRLLERGGIHDILDGLESGRLQVVSHQEAPAPTAPAAERGSPQEQPPAANTAAQAPVARPAAQRSVTNMHGTAPAIPSQTFHRSNDAQDLPYGPSGQPRPKLSKRQLRRRTAELRRTHRIQTGSRLVPAPPKGLPSLFSIATGFAINPAATEPSSVPFPFHDSTR